MTDDFQGTYITENGISKVVVNTGLFFLLDAFSSGIDREEIIEAAYSFISSLIYIQNYLFPIYSL